jgi:hypothetical protein
VAARLALEPHCLSGTSPDSQPSRLHQFSLGRRKRITSHDRVPPLVKLDQIRREFEAVSVTVTQDRIDVQEKFAGMTLHCQSNSCADAIVGTIAIRDCPAAAQGMLPS